jgi:hypothetical protein
MVSDTWRWQQLNPQGYHTNTPIADAGGKR